MCEYFFSSYFFPSSSSSVRHTLYNANKYLVSSILFFSCKLNALEWCYVSNIKQVNCETLWWKKMLYGNGNANARANTETSNFDWNKKTEKKESLRLKINRKGFQLAWHICISNDSRIKCTHLGATWLLMLHCTPDTLLHANRSYTFGSMDLSRM